MSREQEKILFNRLYNNSIRSDGTLIYAGRLLWRAMRERGDSIALIYNAVTITYNQLYCRASSLSTILRESYALKPRSKGIIFFENSPEFYIAYFALWHAGVVVVPVNTFLKEKELAYIITDSAPSIIITSSAHVSLFEKTGVDLPLIVTEQEMVHDTEKDMSEDDSIIDLGADDLAALLYTSGTTGVPKGVMLSSRAIMTNVLQIAALLGIGHQERIIGVLPLFHSFAQNTCIWAAFFYGCGVILVPKIDRKAIIEGLEQKPTIFLGVPALYGLLCMMKNASLSTVRLFVSGGDALPDKIRMGFSLLYRRKIVNGYGLTETSPVIAVDLDDYTKPTSCVGVPLVNIECAIRDDQGRDLPVEAVGVIWVKGDNVMMGYYNAPKATEKVLKNGWFDTGDLGYLNHQGMIVITGRQKDLIIHKGFNIYPQEIENVILSHSNVIRVGVVGKHDGDGEVPIAFVQLRQEQKDIDTQLRSLCIQHLAAYKRPKKFICQTKELPLTATGKIDKKVLRTIVQAMSD